MIDYVKMSCKILDVEGFKRGSQIVFTQNIETRTGEITTPYSRATIKNMDIFLSDTGYLEVKGSIHKYFNGGLHNHNDFSIDDFCSAILALSRLLQVDLWQCKVDTLEVGVNITPAINTSEFLANTYMHGNKPFKNVSVGVGGDYRQAVYKNYWVKIYDKGAQYNCPQQLLRFELKLGADELRRMKLSFMHQLKEDAVIDSLGEMLSDKFDQILFIEPSLQEDNIPLRQREKYWKWNSQRYWHDLATNPPSKNSYRREVSLLSELQAYLTENVKADTLHRIQVKWGELVHIVNSSENDMGKISTSYIDPIIPIPKKCCVTGLDISMQKEESRFLYITGVMYYHDHYPEIFNDLENRLTSRWDREALTHRCREIAHGIRNEYHNRRRSLLAKRSTHPDQLTLFRNEIIEDKSLIDHYCIASKKNIRIGSHSF